MSRKPPAKSGGCRNMELFFFGGGGFAHMLHSTERVVKVRNVKIPASLSCQNWDNRQNLSDTSQRFAQPVAGFSH